MNETEINSLLDRFIKGECTPEESAFVQSWYLHVAKESPVEFTIEELAEVDARTRSNFPAPIVKRRIPSYLKYAAAATVALITVTCVFYLSSRRQADTITKTNIAIIQPGGNNATLTLANGTTVNLQDTQLDTVANVSGTLITNNTSNGIVTFNGSKADDAHNHNKTDQAEINTISTPGGGQYQLILPDGSLVFLNASSKLQFPTHFAGNFRKVILEGEAYFEIKKDAKKPFIVSADKQELTVLGTHFNVSAYPNETIKTTLAEGRVKLRSSSSLQNQLLKPDQQASLLSTGGFKVQNVNAVEAMAWKDGDFVFNQAPVAEMLHQLCRWYNVEADYDHLPDVPVSANVSRKRTLAELIRFIEVTNGIKITISDERRLTVSKK